MDQRQIEFLTAVLGDSGSAALRKAADRCVELGDALVPRAILAWLGLSTSYEYEGILPGVENTYVAFKKSDSTFSGSIAIGEDVYTFDRADVYNLAGCVAVALGADVAAAGQVSDNDLVRLGKSIDTLVKARVLTDDLLRKRENRQGLPGKQAPFRQTPIAAPTPTQQEKAPQAPKPKKSTIPKYSKPLIKITKAQSENRCPLCALKQMVQGKFVGCACFAVLAKSVKVTSDNNGYTLEFKPEVWDDEAIATLAESFGK